MRAYLLWAAHPPLTWWKQITSATEAAPSDAVPPAASPAAAPEADSSPFPEPAPANQAAKQDPTAEHQPASWWAGIAGMRRLIWGTLPETPAAASLPAARTVNGVPTPPTATVPSESRAFPVPKQQSWHLADVAAVLPVRTHLLWAASRLVTWWEEGTDASEAAPPAAVPTIPVRPKAAKPAGEAVHGAQPEPVTTMGSHPAQDLGAVLSTAAVGAALLTATVIWALYRWMDAKLAEKDRLVQQLTESLREDRRAARERQRLHAENSRLCGQLEVLRHQQAEILPEVGLRLCTHPVRLSAANLI